MWPPVQLVGAVVSIVFLAAFSWFFLKSRIGIAMRAVADSQQVAMAMGIDVRRYFALAWAMAGGVSAPGGGGWGGGGRGGEQPALVGLQGVPPGVLGGPGSGVRAGVGGAVGAGLVEPSPRGVDP